LPSDTEIPKSDEGVAEIKPNLFATVEDVSDDEEGGAACMSMDTLLEDWVKGPADEPALLDNPTEMTGAVRGLDGDTSGQDDESDWEASSDENSYDDWSDEEHLDDDTEPNLEGGPAERDKSNDVREEPGVESSLTRYHREAQDVAEEMLKAVNLRKVKSKYYDSSDRNAHEEGKMDARDIDVKRKRIEDGKSDAQEVEIGSNVERMAGRKMSRASLSWDEMWNTCQARVMLRRGRQSSRLSNSSFTASTVGTVPTWTLHSHTFHPPAIQRHGIGLATTGDHAFPLPVQLQLQFHQSPKSVVVDHW